MSRIRQVGERLRQATDLAAMLDAAYDAFEEMLAVIRAHEDPDDGMFTVLVMAAASTADARDAILFAPSLPPRPLQPAVAGAGHDLGGTVAGAVAALAGLSELLATRLQDAVRMAPGPGDRRACSDGARWARDVHILLTGGGP